MITIAKDIELTHPLLGFISHVDGADPLIVVRSSLPDDQLWRVALRFMELYQAEHRRWPTIQQVLVVEHPIDVHRLIYCSTTDLKV